MAKPKEITQANLAFEVQQILVCPAYSSEKTKLINFECEQRMLGGRLQTETIVESVNGSKHRAISDPVPVIMNEEYRFEAQLWCQSVGTANMAWRKMRKRFMDIDPENFLLTRCESSFSRGEKDGGITKHISLVYSEITKWEK